jgi:hypothetical protein
MGRTTDQNSGVPPVPLDKWERNAKWVVGGSVCLILIGVVSLATGGKYTIGPLVVGTIILLLHFVVRWDYRRRYGAASEDEDQTLSD